MAIVCFQFFILGCNLKIGAIKKHLQHTYFKRSTFYTIHTLGPSSPKGPIGPSSPLKKSEHIMA